MDKTGLILICTIILLIFILGITSAETIYAGGCNSLEFPNTDPIEWSVEGNSSDMEGFSYNKIGTNITYCFHPLYKPDNFILTFYNYQYIEERQSRGGGGCRYDEDYDWNCSEWGDCINETQARICKEYNNCGSVYGRPNITRGCVDDDSINDTEIIGGCGTVVPGLEDECCQNLGFDRWNKETLECEHKTNYLLLILIILILVIILIILYDGYRKKRAKSEKVEDKK